MEDIERKQNGNSASTSLQSSDCPVLLKVAFGQLGLKKIPKVAELNEEFNRLAKEKNAEYAQYRIERDRMRNLANARRNAGMILQDDEFARTTEVISK